MQSPGIRGRKKAGPCYERKKRKKDAWWEKKKREKGSSAPARVQKEGDAM